MIRWTKKRQRKRFRIHHSRPDTRRAQKQRQICAPARSEKKKLTHTPIHACCSQCLTMNNAWTPTRLRGNEKRGCRHQASEDYDHPWGKLLLAGQRITNRTCRNAASKSSMAMGGIISTVTWSISLILERPLRTGPMAASRHSCVMSAPE